VARAHVGAQSAAGPDSGAESEFLAF